MRARNRCASSTQAHSEIIISMQSELPCRTEQQRSAERQLTRIVEANDDVVVVGGSKQRTSRTQISGCSRCECHTQHLHHSNTLHQHSKLHSSFSNEHRY